jgi:CRP/FNR family transcriptional regulator, cyclic AMP receptor protein
MHNKILIVEDNVAILENTTELLELSNYTVVSASNGKDGLAAALEEKPDLILCDIIMPGMDGYHLLEHVRKVAALQNTRFIFFTASAEKKEVEDGMRLGADDYIVKPFLGDLLLEKIEKLLNKASLLNLQLLVLYLLL